MKFCLDITPSGFLEKPDYYLDLWRRCGIDSVQLEFAAVKWRASLEDTAKARELIRNAGFECALISVPVGHPGEPHEASEVLPMGWRFRTGRDGQPEYNSSELTDKMIADTIAYSKQYVDLGFDTLFLDDDTRIGNLTTAVCGCFCEDCIREFSALEGKKYTREALLEADEEVLKRWCRFQSKHVTKLVYELGKIVEKPGLMIMNSGDERHGISPHDIAKIKNVQVRVGEEHFFDDAARNPFERLNNFSAVTAHLFRLGSGVETYSETTVIDYIPGMTITTPEHTFSKALLALTAGVKNIDWMCTKHYGMMEEKNGELRRYAQEICGDRAYPVHIARDSFASGAIYYADTYATSLGLPAAPVFDDEATGGEILVLPDHLYDRSEWKAAAEKYRYAVKPSELKAVIAKTDIPHAETEDMLCLSYIPSRNRIALFNPLEVEQTAVVCGQSIKLDAGGAGYLDI